MAKLEIPKFRYLAQDEDGYVWGNSCKPICTESQWIGGGDVVRVRSGKENPNWRNTLINLETDDYDFFDGILRRIEK